MNPTIDVEQWKREARAAGARALLVVFDRYPWPSECYPLYVMPGESIAAKFAEYDAKPFQHVAAVHLL